MNVQIIELALLALSPWPFLRTAVRRPTRRAFPCVSAVLVAAAALWLAGLAFIAVWSPLLLHGIAAIAAIVAVTAIWRGRSDYGRGRRLPPGSLALSRSLEALLDRRFYQRQTERHGPVFKMSQFHQPVVCIVGLKRGHRLFREHRESLGPSVLALNRYIHGGFLRYMDDRRHDVYGPLFRKALLQPVMEEARSTTEDAVSRELARGVAEGEPRDGGSVAVDPDPILARIILVAFLRALFGVTPDDPWFDRLTRAYRPLARHRLSTALGESQKAALRELRDLLAQLGEEQRTGADDLRQPISTLSELACLGAGAPDDICLDNLISILKIATDNVAGLSRWLLVTLGSHPEWIAKVRSEDEALGTSTSPALPERIVMETLRLAQSEYLYRRVRREIEFDGFRLPQGWLVRLCVWESHRTPETFRNPEVFDPDRFLDGPIPQSVYSPFGTGRHACNGVPLTNLIATTLVERLCHDYNWTVEGHGPPVRRLRHWDHWRPHPRLRLVLRPA